MEPTKLQPEPEGSRSPAPGLGLDVAESGGGRGGERGRLRTQGGQAGEGRALSRDGCSEKATHIRCLVFPKLMSVLILFLLGTFWDLPQCLGSCGFGALLSLQGRGPGSLAGAPVLTLLSTRLPRFHLLVFEA